MIKLHMFCNIIRKLSQFNFRDPVEYARHLQDMCFQFTFEGRREDRFSPPFLGSRRRSLHIPHPATRVISESGPWDAVEGKGILGILK